MSTRCQIALYDHEPKDINEWEVLLYRHSDGYPDTKHGVLAFLKPALDEFIKGRGWDVEYMGAWLMYRLKDDYIKSNYEWRKEMWDNKEWGYQDKYKTFDEYVQSNKPNNFLGHGVSKVFHADIEYLYVVFPNELRVYNCHSGWWDSPSFKSLTLVEKHVLND